MNEEFQISSAELLIQKITELENKGIDHKKALKQAAKEFGVSRSEAYRIWQSEMGN